MTPSIQATVISNSASNFSKSWNDDGSGADCDVQFWRPLTQDGQFRPAGDVCEASPSNWIYDTDNPRSQIALLAPLPGVDGMLATPLDFEQVWNDEGSGAKQDGTIWKPVCPPGYIYLGHMITTGDSRPKPHSTDYWCVSSKLVIRAEEGAQIWNDHGSDAKRDVGVWRLVSSNSARFIDLGTFYATDNHDVSTISGYVLDPAAVQWVG